MRLHPMTTRRWLITIALLAFVGGSGLRSYRNHAKADRHRHYASQLLIGSEAEQHEADFLQAYLDSGGVGVDYLFIPKELKRLEQAGVPALRRRVDQARVNERTYRKEAEAHARMARLYEQAAWRPWLAVPE